uniref:Uncharacterized protein n=1 Tax=Romanomermis culicivorax TaxID=13658 RepID=A0A915KIJ8_ROMCU
MKMDRKLFAVLERNIFVWLTSLDGGSSICDKNICQNYGSCAIIDGKSICKFLAREEYNGDVKV